MLARPTAATVLADRLPDRWRPFVLVPADVGAAERAHILSDSGCPAWLGDAPDDLAGLPHIPVRLHARSWHSHAEPAPDAPAYVVAYTSGTTGAPKGVQTSRRAVAADIDALATAWQWNAGDTLVHGLPLFHVHSLCSGYWDRCIIGNRFVHRKTHAGGLCGGGRDLCFGGADRGE